MPIVNVQMLSGRTTAQKKAFIQQVTEVAVRTLDVPERAVVVVLSEVSPDGWGSAGRTMADLLVAKSTP